MQYCQTGENFTDIWVDKGINPCFLYSVTSAVLFLVIFIGGYVQCTVFRKYSTPIDAKFRRGACGYVFQYLFTIILISEAVIHVILQDTSIAPQNVAGYQLLTVLVLVVGWMGSLKVLSLERNRALPTIPTRGHGLVLLMFWSLAFLKENLAFVSWWSHQWWWHLDR